MDLKEIYTKVHLLLDMGLEDDDIIANIPRAFRPEKVLEMVKNDPYDPEKTIDIAKRLCILGYTDTHLCEYFQIDPMLFNMWKEAIEGFKDALEKCRLDTDAKVAYALLRLALGYVEKDVKLFHYQGEVIEHPYMKRYEPNMAAIKMWLETRQKGIWNNPEMVEMALSLNVDPSQLSDAEINDIIADAGYTAAAPKLTKLTPVEE